MTVSSRIAVRRNPVATFPTRPVTPSPRPAWPGFQIDPYVDYGRVLTAEGGILIVYKDLDLRFRHTLWRLFAWSAFTGFEGWSLLTHSPLHNPWINLACFLVIALVNRLVVASPVEVYRRIEIRPDCMIVEGAEVFWRRFMEGGWPSFKGGSDGGQVLCGIYGTHFVEYLTVRSFDEYDRAPKCSPRICKTRCNNFGPSSSSESCSA